MQCTFEHVFRRRRATLLVSAPVLVMLLATTAGSATRAAGSPPATQANAGGSAVKVSWPDIVRLIDQHPRLAGGALRVDAARAGRSAAGSVPNPSLETTAGKGLERGSDGSRAEWGLELTVPLGWIAQRRSKLAAAQAEVDVALAESGALRREVLLQLRTLFWTLAGEQASVSALEALEAQTAALVQTVQRRVEKGESRPVEATRVEIELEKVRSERETAAISLSARQSEMALWVAPAHDATIVVDADLDALPVASDLATALAGARKTHPLLALARARTRSLQAELASETMARVPAFSISGFTEQELDRQAYGVGLNVEVPLWNWNSSDIAQAEARLSAQRKEAASEALEVEAAVIQAQSACRASVATASRQKQTIVPLSVSAASTMERTYELGEASLLEVIDARRTLLDSRRLYLDALAQAHIDCSRLDAMTGEDR